MEWLSRHKHVRRKYSQPEGGIEAQEGVCARPTMERRRKGFRPKWSESSPRAAALKNSNAPLSTTQSDQSELPRTGSPPAYAVCVITLGYTGAATVMASMYRNCDK
eukprot:5738400-Pleurochrysis_carterae.AAC.2